MSIFQTDDDPWMLRPEGRTKTHPVSGSLHIKAIEGIEPLDSQIGSDTKKTVPHALHDVLFGQSSAFETKIVTPCGYQTSVPAIHTYAILDAAKIANLPELLERSGLEYRCLFNGDAYINLKDVAPWLVRLEEDSIFTRNLFTRSRVPWHLWDTEPGIYVRSRNALETTWKHFRKFTRIPDENRKWYYFRFWEPSYFITACVLARAGHLSISTETLFSSIISDYQIICTNDAACYVISSNQALTNPNPCINHSDFELLFAANKLKWRASPPGQNDVEILILKYLCKHQMLNLDNLRWMKIIMSAPEGALFSQRIIENNLLTNIIKQDFLRYLARTLS